MGGLAMGNYYFGRIADRIENCLKAYGTIELSIAIYALLTPLILMLGRWVFTVTGSQFGPGSTASLVLKVLIAFATIIFPVTLMGGTLPIMARVVIETSFDIKSRVGALYSVNSLGAVVGAVVTAFFLVPTTGLNKAIFTTAILNLLVGLIAIAIQPLYSPKNMKPEGANEAGISTDGVTDFQLKMFILAVTLSGGISMIYEIAWFRLFALVLGSSTYSFALMLAAFITGISLGSLIASRWSPGSRRGVYSFLVFCHFAVGISVSASLLIYERLPFLFFIIRSSSQLLKSSFHSLELVKYAFVFSIMLIPTTLLGMVLPLTMFLTSKKAESVGCSLGRTFAANTIGAMIGSLLAGFLLLPLLGLKLTFVLGAVLNVALASALLYSHYSLLGLKRIYRLALVASPPVLVLALGLFSPQWSPAVMSSGGFRTDYPYTQWSQFAEFKLREFCNKVLYYKDGSQVTVMVGKSEEDNNVFLTVNGKTDASSLSDRKTQVMLAHIPALLHQGPKSALNVGLGSGATCAGLLAYDTLQKLEVAEISREVQDACQCFKDYNREFYKDPRVTIYIEDAKTFLLLSKNKYDIIVSEPSNPWISGVASLFTYEFFNQAKDHLAANGIFAQWFHGYEISDENSKIILRTLARVFPYVSVWSIIGLDDFVFIASQEPISVNYAVMAERMKAARVAFDLEQVGVLDVPSFLAHETIPNDSLRAAIGDGPINTDDNQILEYGAPRDFFFRHNSIAFYRDLDEKQTNLSHGALLIQKYLEQHELTEQNLVGLSNVLDDPNSNLLASLVQCWAKSFPVSPTLAESKLLLQYDVRNDLVKLKELETGRWKNGKRVDRVTDYLRNYFRVYRATRTIFYTIPMQRWLNLCKGAMEKYPDRKPLFEDMVAVYRRIEGLK